MLDKLPRLRKFGINTTGLTPHRAIPMLTKIVEICDERGVIFSTRVSIDGVGDMHNTVRKVKRGFDKANADDPRDAGAAEEASRSTSASRPRSSHMNLDDAENILAWAKQGEAGHRVQHGPLHRCHARQQRARSDVRSRSARRRADARSSSSTACGMDPLLDGQNYIYMHYADMIANGYHRMAPCPFQTQGIMLNPDGGMFFCENSEVVGNVRETDPEAALLHAPPARRTATGFATRSARPA